MAEELVSKVDVLIIGATTLEAITQALNQRRIRSASGGQWRASSVAYLLGRSAKSTPGGATA
jgi:hypothetical protein